MVQQPIQNRRGDHPVPEDVPPVGEALVGGEDDRPPFIPSTDELEEQVRPLPIDGQIPNLIHDEQARDRVELELLLQPILGEGLTKGGHHRSRRGEEDPVAVVDRLEPESHRQVRLAHPGWTKQHEILSQLDEPTGGEGLELLLIQRGLSAPVEGLEGLDEWEAGEIGAHGNIFLSLRGDLLGEDGVQKVRSAPLLGTGLLQEGLQSFATLEESEPLAVFLEPFTLDSGHTAPPAWAQAS